MTEEEKAEIELLREIPDFYERLWECGNCATMFTGQSIREHMNECPPGDTVRFKL